MIGKRHKGDTAHTYIFHHYLPPPPSFPPLPQDIIHTSEDEEGVLPDPAEKFEQLLERVRAKDHKKRTMGRIPLSLGNGLELGVGM